MYKVDPITRIDAFLERKARQYPALGLRRDVTA